MILACITNALTPNPILGFLVKVKTFVPYKTITENSSGAGHGDHKAGPLTTALRRQR